MIQKLIDVLKDPTYQHDLIRQIGQHISLSLTAVGLAVAVGVSLGIFLTRRPGMANPVMVGVGLLQTLPSLALLAFMIPVLGIGRPPAVAALFVYALLPIVRNTYTGIKGVDSAAVEAGRGMGMTGRQLLFLVELPLAFRVIMSGVRVSTVLVIGWATLAAYIGAGGLGDAIIRGFSSTNPGYILSGGIPVTLLALLADFVLGRAERAVTPRGMRV